jgi:hypothetical protein
MISYLLCTGGYCWQTTDKELCVIFLMLSGISCGLNKQPCGTAALYRSGKDCHMLQNAATENGNVNEAICWCYNVCLISLKV